MSLRRRVLAVLDRLGPSSLPTLVRNLPAMDEQIVSVLAEAVAEGAVHFEDGVYATLSKGHRWACVRGNAWPSGGRGGVFGIPMSEISGRIVGLRDLFSAQTPRAKPRTGSASRSRSSSGGHGLGTIPRHHISTRRSERTTSSSD